MNLTSITQTEYSNVEEKKIVSTHKETSKYQSKVLEVYKEFLAIHRADKDIQPLLKNLQKYIGTTNTSMYSQEDITTFCLQLINFEEDESFFISGLFLSQLVNDHYERTHEEKEYILVTNHLQEKMSYLCRKNNGANIRVKGSAASYFADEMKEGIIILEGDCEHELGMHMKGGLVHVLGNCTVGCGQQLSSGYILVFGNAGDCVGANMKGGIVEVKGHVGTDIGINMRGGLLKFHEDITGKISHTITRDPTYFPDIQIQVNEERIV